jgi:tetratricopeptide (TPR) repeat protein
MLYLNLLLFLFIFVSCSSGRIERKIDDPSWDSLADESYLRWGKNRFSNSDGAQSKIVNCYQNKIDDTLEVYKKNYLHRAKDTLYWLHIGNCYFMNEQWSKAEFFYQLTLEESKNAQVKLLAQNNLALLYFKYDEWEKGRDLLKDVIKASPGLKVPRYNLAQLYLQFGHFDKAIEILTAPDFRARKDIDIFFSLANAYMFKGDLIKAREYFSLIPDKYFLREDIASTYALYLLQTGKFKEAKKIMDSRDRSGIKELGHITNKIEQALEYKLKED